MRTHLRVDPLVTGALRVFHDTFDAEHAKHPADATWRVGGKASKANPNKEDAAFYRGKAAEWIAAYVKWRRSNPQFDIWHTPEGVPAIELTVRVYIPGTRILLRGSIDQVLQNFDEGELHIVDRKSGSSAQVSALQLAFYRLALWLQFGVRVRYGSYYSVREGRLDALYDLEQFSDEQLMRYLRNMKRSVVDLRDFTPSISRDCGYCDVRKHCYVWSPEVPRPVFTDDLEVVA